MQTDTWLTDTSYPDRCPLCSQPLPGGSNTCPACGFTAHEPVDKAFSAPHPSVSRSSHPLTPIPARASALRAQSRPGRTASERSQAARSGQELASSASPTSPQGGSWRHDSSSYEAASSLSALSLIISETPTAPPRTPRSTGRLEHIDEIDTVPESSGRTPALRRSSDHVRAVPSDVPRTALSLGDLIAPEAVSRLVENHAPVPFAHIDEIDTLPEVSSTSSGALVPAREVPVDAASWTAGPGSTSSLAASFIAARSPRRRRRARRFNPLDRTRWWLLRRGHMEFLLWLAGSTLLFGITFVLLLAAALSLMVPGFSISGNFPTSTVNASSLTPAKTLAAFPGMHLTLTGKHNLAPGAEIHLQGAGFHPKSQVVFLLDGRLPLLNQSGQAASVRTGANGRFSASLWLGQGPSWSTGPHQLLARESASGHQVALAITIMSTSNPTIPGVTSVQNPPVASVNPTPTPEPPTPTPLQPTPTPTAQPPASTPTSTASPAASPTAGATASPIASATAGRGQPTAGSSTLGNALNTEDDNSLLSRLAHLNPLVWLIVTCYFASLLLLGLAGILRKQRH